MFSEFSGVSSLSFGNRKQTIRRYTESFFAVLLATALVGTSLTGLVGAAPPSVDERTLLLAAGERASVLTATTGNNTTNHNGSEWYLNAGSSMGFAPGGATVDLNPADITVDPATDALRLSWHRNGNLITDGWRVGAERGVSGEGTRYIYQANSLPSYYPSGPQSGVGEVTVTGGGWTLCYSGSYADVVDIDEVFANLCTENYLMYAGSLDPKNYLDITVDGRSLLGELGDQSGDSVFSGDILDMQLYGNDKTTAINWDDFIIYRTLNCNPTDCNPSNPVDNPSNWNAGTVVTNSQYAINQDDENQYLWVYQADDSTGELVPGTDSIVLAVLQTPVDSSIDTCEELLAVDDAPSSQFSTISLTGNIDCEGQVFEPLFQSFAFEGTIVGNGFTISNVSIDAASNQDVAIISETAGFVSITDINLQNIQVTGREHVGALIGRTDGGFSIQNVHANNVDIVGTNGGGLGGLLGDIDIEDGLDSTITNVSVQGTVDCVEDCSDIGGMAGMIESQSSIITINKVYADVEVVVLEENGGNDVGGLIGETEADNDVDGTYEARIIIANAYAWGNVAAETNTNVGGLIGRVDVEHGTGSAEDISIEIDDVYASGNVAGGDRVGGLFGTLDAVNDELDVDVYSVNSVFAIGQVSELTPVDGARQGGIYGYFGQADGGGSVDAYNVLSSSENYFDESRTNQEGCNSVFAVDNCVAVNPGSSQPDYFFNNMTNPPLDNWNFNTVWVTNTDNPPTFRMLAVADTDEDGVSDDIEDNAPNNGDGDGDGILDKDQGGVASFASSVTNKYITIVAGGDGQSCVTTDQTSNSEAAQQTTDVGYGYTNGLIGFEAYCAGEQPGHSMPVSVIFHGTSPDSFVLRKYNPNTNAYFTVPNAQIAGDQIGGTTVTIASYIITDGGELDIDGIADGYIKDPVGLGVLSVGAPNTGIQKL